MSRFLIPSLFLSSYLLLPACGGGGGGGGGGAAASISAKSTFTDDDIRHLLMRTHFGAKQSEFDAVKAQGVPAYINAMTAFPAIGSTSWEQNADLLLENASDPVGLEGGFPSEGQLARWWLSLMLNNTNPFQESVALFWHDRFATSSSVLSSSSRYWMKKHVNLLREKGTGNLRDLLVALARDWAMLKWLDGVISVKGQPNENFAREFWELFTLGVDKGYTQADILEAAEAFTGYEEKFNATTNQSYIQFNVDKHEPGAKVPLGVVLPGQSLTDDYQAIVDITLENRPVAEYVCTRIAEWFCYPNPPKSLVDALAKKLRDSNYELAPVFQTLFKSQAFYSDAAKNTLVRNPLDACVGFVRTTGLVFEIDQMDSQMNTLKQRPTQPPGVNGWPQGILWLSSQGMVDHANFFNTCITKRSFQQSLGVNLGANILPPSGPQLSGDVVDHLAHLLGVELSDAERTTCATYLDTKVNSNGTTTPSLFTAGDPQHIDERGRGLLYILVQHPSYFIK